MPAQLRYYHRIPVSPNVFSTRNITLDFPKFLLLLEMNGMKERNEDNGCSLSLSQPWKAPYTHRFPHWPQHFVMGRATVRAEGGSMVWKQKPPAIARERRTTYTDPGATKVFPQRIRKRLHRESHSCVGLWGAKFMNLRKAEWRCPAVTHHKSKHNGYYLQTLTLLVIFYMLGHASYALHS